MNAAPVRNLGVADLFSKRLIGHLGELQPANYLRSYGYALFFPGGSRGPADFIAIRHGVILAVQCKSTQLNLCDYDTDRLLVFAEPLDAVPVFTTRVNGRVKWHLWNGSHWQQVECPKWKNLHTEAAAACGASK
jgi:Holliday junction resolvase